MVMLVVRSLLAYLSLSGVGLGVWGILHLRRGRVNTSSPSWGLPESLIVSLFVLAVGSWVPSVLGMTLLKEFFFVFTVCSLSGVCVAALALFRQMRGGGRLPRLRLSPWKASTAALLAFYALIASGIPKMNWDALQYFILHAEVMLESNGIPLLYPTARVLFATPFEVNSPATSIVYAYLIHMIGLPAENGSAARVVASYVSALMGVPLVVLSALLVLVRRYAEVLYGNRDLLDCVVVVLLATPLFVSLFAVSPLNADVLVMLSLLGLVYFGMNWFRTGSAAQLACLLASATLLILAKVNGVVLAAVGVSILMITRVTRGGFVLILAGLGSLGVAGAVLLIFRNWGIFNLPALGSLENLVSLGTVAALLLYLGVGLSRTPRTETARLRASTIPASMTLAVSLLAVLSYVVRNVVLTGSPFMSFWPLLVGDQLWAHGVVDSARIWVPNYAPGLPDSFPRLFVTGYQLHPHLVAAALAAATVRRLRGPRVIQANHIMVLVCFLVWLLVLGFRSARHLAFMLPFYAVLLVDGLAAVASSRQGGGDGNCKATRMLAALSVFAALPFIAAALSEVLPSTAALAPFGDWFSNAREWFLQPNQMRLAWFVTGFLLVAFMLVQLPKRWASAARAVLERALPVCLTVGLAIPMLTYVSGRWAAREHGYENFDNRIAPLLQALREAEPATGGVLGFYGWASQLLVGTVRPLCDLRYTYNVGMLRDLLTADLLDRQLEELEALAIRFVVVPVLGTKSQMWLQLAEASNSRFLSGAYVALSDAVPGAWSAGSGWMLREVVGTALLDWEHGHVQLVPLDPSATATASHLPPTEDGGVEDVPSRGAGAEGQRSEGLDRVARRIEIPHASRGEVEVHLLAHGGSESLGGTEIVISSTDAHPSLCVSLARRLVSFFAAGKLVGVATPQSGEAVDIRLLFWWGPTGAAARVSVAGATFLWRDARSLDSASWAVEMQGLSPDSVAVSRQAEVTWTALSHGESR